MYTRLSFILDRLSVTLARPDDITLAGSMLVFRLIQLLRRTVTLSIPGAPVTLISRTA